MTPDSALLESFGRFHVAVLHAPIGLLIGLGALELATTVRPSAIPRGAHLVVAWLAAASAVLAAATGFTLGLEESERGYPLATHRALGIATAACATFTAIALTSARGGAREDWSVAYRMALVLTLGLLVPTGHLGGTMTHGEGWLTQPLRDTRDAETPASAPASAPAPTSSASPALAAFARAVAPILERRCSECHAPGPRKGKLVLTTAEGLATGGKSGAVLSREKPDDSLMLRRLRLPLDAKGHMPPKDKPQPTAAELAYLETWSRAVAALEDPHLADVALGGPASSRASSAPASRPLAAADPSALAALRARLAHVQPLAQGSPLLWIDFAAPAAKTSDDDVRALLAPVREQVTDLSLNRSKITDASMAFVAALPRLRRLELRATAVTDAGVDALRASATLEELALTETRVGDAAVDSIAAMPALKRVYLWKSAVTKEGLAKLRAARPTLDVDAGDVSDSVALAVEEPVSVSKVAVAPAAGAKTHAPASLEPVNTVCPVSGQPVVPAYRVVFEGRVIGFCCPNCPAKFWADPSAYRSKLP